MRFARRPDCQHTGIYFLFGRDSEMNDTVYIGEAEKMSKRLKFDFYQQAIQAQRYVVTNGAVPAWSSVSEYDQAMLSEFIDHAKLLIATLGYKPFEGIGIPGGAEDFPPETVQYSIAGSRGADARGISVADGFTVLRGSGVCFKNSLRLDYGVFSAISASENLDLAPLNLRFSSLI